MSKNVDSKLMQSFQYSLINLVDKFVNKLIKWINFLVTVKSLNTTFIQIRLLERGANEQAPCNTNHWLEKTVSFFLQVVHSTSLEKAFLYKSIWNYALFQK